MTKYRDTLPQLGGKLFLTDGGIETCLIFHDGFDLPHFAAFALLRTDAGREALKAYYERYVRVAVDRGVGFILESATWRASPDWGNRLGYPEATLAEINREAIELLHGLRWRHETKASPMVISGCIGPRGDGYVAGEAMSPEMARTYHGFQVRCFAEAGADMVTAITMTNSPEAIGLASAAVAAGMPCVISFTLETDGRLPSGEELGNAVRAVDTATDNAPAYYMINCAHPTHFDAVLAGEAWVQRIRGLRTNASRMSHAELNDAAELDVGDPAELGAENAALRARHRHINVLGGCCGTDHRHVDQMCAHALAA